jgi:hypothetical protein
MKNSDCDESKICSNNHCADLTCNTCEHIVNHECVKYDCCSNDECQGEESCNNHVCEKVLCGLGSSAENHECVGIAANLNASEIIHNPITTYALIGIVALIALFLGFKWYKGNNHSKSKEKKKIGSNDCPKCGNPISKNEKFCAKCGAKLK